MHESRAHAVLRLGLTGGIGSGKSTVARMLVACGAALIDADAISRRTTAVDGLAIGPVRGQFGPQAVTAEGAMDRDFMRQLVFNQPEARQKLEAIIHPLVAQETLREARAAADAGSRCIVFDIPLLVESGRWRQQLDKIMVIDCDEATQISRVMARESGQSNWARETVEKVIAGQASRKERLAAADICLSNEGVTLVALEAQVRRVYAGFGL